VVGGRHATQVPVLRSHSGVGPVHGAPHGSVSVELDALENVDDDHSEEVDGDEVDSEVDGDEVAAEEVDTDEVDDVLDSLREELAEDDDSPVELSPLELWEVCLLLDRCEPLVDPLLDDDELSVDDVDELLAELASCRAPSAAPLASAACVSRAASCPVTCGASRFASCVIVCFASRDIFASAGPRPPSVWPAPPSRRAPSGAPQSATHATWSMLSRPMTSAHDARAPPTGRRAASASAGPRRLPDFDITSL
jgi:hypothetical protein